MAPTRRQAITWTDVGHVLWRSASLAFVCGIHRWPVNSPHKGPVTRKMFPFHYVIMWYGTCLLSRWHIASDISNPDEIALLAKSSGWLRVTSYIIRLRDHLEVIKSFRWLTQISLCHVDHLSVEALAHNSDVMMSLMASQITSLAIAY